MGADRAVRARRSQGQARPAQQWPPVRGRAVVDGALGRALA
ncbi:hypothetical protein CCNA_01265 [Caulobacter vibrioides NA1000]|uniref:Uncharacterized protein n=1 Tax=Caulobacter vibrioides (strain NA1000 / CB15N) TaxID=565050 RepID=A0A0H3C644_CAUVN|nr:hypothetical protein [Caulobacter vibrioides]YP_002516638.1 hypothetical protein CCNA_01265 [Caulobacter vibrioides NA1000]ACL94730.1 hypothetical protein CCNA_01265 [Caulobacter vibrioides NA1000]